MPSFRLLNWTSAYVICRANWYMCVNICCTIQDKVAFPWWRIWSNNVHASIASKNRKNSEYSKRLEKQAGVQSKQCICMENGMGLRLEHCCIVWNMDMLYWNVLYLYAVWRVVNKKPSCIQKKEKTSKNPVFRMNFGKGKRNKRFFLR